ELDDIKRGKVTLGNNPCHSCSSRKVNGADTVVDVEWVRDLRVVRRARAERGSRAIHRRGRRYPSALHTRRYYIKRVQQDRRRWGLGATRRIRKCDRVGLGAGA